MIEDKKLIKALETDNLQMLEELKNYGYDFNQVNIAELYFSKNIDFTIETIQYLLNNGTNVDSESKRNFTSLMIPDIKLVKLLLENGADLNYKNKNGLLPVNVASEYKIIKLFVEYGFDINQEDENGGIPLTKSADTKHTQLLVDNGVDINHTNSYGETPLIRGVKEYNIELVEILIQHKVNIGIKDADSRSALDHAIELRDQEMVKLLLKNGADVNEQRQDMSMLMGAVITGSSNLAKLLIDYGANIDTHTDDGVTALTIAIINIYKDDAVRKISKKNLDDNNILKKMLDHAKEHIDIFKLLIENDANVNVSFKGYPSFFMLVEKGLFDLIKLMIAHGLNINMISEDGQTALLTAIIHNKKKVAKLLIENGADVNARDKDGITALMAASKLGYTDIVKLLIENGADVNANNKEGLTSLVFAIASNNFDILKILIENNADINIGYVRFNGGSPQKKCYT